MSEPETSVPHRVGNFRRFALPFVVISIATTIIVVSCVGGPTAILDALAGMDVRYLALLPVILVAEWVTDVYRYRTVARSLGVRVSYPLSIRITFANLFFAYLTPGGGFGAPVVTYMLYRRGVDLPRAIAIALIKPFLVLFVLIPGLVLLTLLGGQSFVSATAVKVVIASTGGLAWMAIMIILVSALWPGVARKVVDAPLRWIMRRRFLQKRFSGHMGKLRGGVHQTIEAFGMYLRNGAGRVLASFLAAVANVVGICGVCVVLLYGLGATGPPLQMWGLSLLYVAVISVSPTPGGSGIAEGTGMAIFAACFHSDEQTAAFVLIWRILTCYLPLLIGATMFAQFLGQTPMDEITDLTKSAESREEPSGGA